MKLHKHAELIKAWADGATIECNDCGVWFYANNPTWQENMEYRIKPEPKPDVVGYLYQDNSVWREYRKEQYNRNDDLIRPAIKLTFDGETGEPKSAEVLK